MKIYKIPKRLLIVMIVIIPVLFSLVIYICIHNLVLVNHHLRINRHLTMSAAKQILLNDPEIKHFLAEDPTNNDLDCCGLSKGLKGKDNYWIARTQHLVINQEEGGGIVATVDWYMVDRRTGEVEKVE
ncbi:MAG: hypothetical protein WCJ58_03055 [bacterium]